jgi:hypothetical protein
MLVTHGSKLLSALFGSAERPDVSSGGNFSFLKLKVCVVPWAVLHATLYFPCMGQISPSAQ